MSLIENVSAKNIKSQLPGHTAHNKKNVSMNIAKLETDHAF